MMNGHSELNNLKAKLSGLDNYFENIPTHYNSEEDLALVAKIKPVRQLLDRPQKQVTFFGAFKTGKSTLLNALLGKKILPSRTNRATGVVTKISYSPQPSAEVIRHGNNTSYQQSIPVEDIDKYILLDVSETTAKATEDIESR